MHTVTGSLAYQLTPRLSLGASFNYWLGEWNARGDRVIRVFDAPMDRTELAVAETEFRQAQSFRGFNANLGFLLRYARVSIGGVLQLPFSGDYGLDDLQATRTTVGEEMTRNRQETRVTSQLAWPRVAGIGVAFRPVSRLTLAFDLASSKWSRTYIEELPDGVLLTPAADGDVAFTDRNFFDLLPKTVTSTRDALRWHVGGEYLVTLPSVVVPLRAGWFRDHSPVADIVTDEGRPIDGFTLGSGLNFQSFVLDFAYERRESDGFVGLRQFGQGPEALNSNEVVVQNRFVGSLIYRFTDDDPVRRAFRKVFVRAE